MGNLGVYVVWMDLNAPPTESQENDEADKAHYHITYATAEACNKCAGNSKEKGNLDKFLVSVDYGSEVVILIGVRQVFRPPTKRSYLNLL